MGTLKQIRQSNRQTVALDGESVKVIPVLVGPPALEFDRSLTVC
jgi:hypothetical protein